MKKLLTVAVLAGLLCGCASYRIPTPAGMATIHTFFMAADIPKFSESSTVNGVTNVTMTLEGYSTKGDSQMMTATAGAISTIINGAIQAGIMAKAGMLPLATPKP